MSECEYNPVAKRAKYEGEPCHNEATLSVGGNGEWHVCASCAALPAFRRYRKRITLRRVAAKPHAN